MSLPTATDRTAVEAALDALVAALTLDEKTGLVVGADLWATRGLERIGLDPVVMSDGPVGVRDPYHGGASAMLPAPPRSPRPGTSRSPPAPATCSPPRPAGTASTSSSPRRSTSSAPPSAAGTSSATARTRT